MMVASKYRYRKIYDRYLSNVDISGECLSAATRTSQKTQCFSVTFNFIANFAIKCVLSTRLEKCLQPNNAPKSRTVTYEAP